MGTGPRGGFAQASHPALRASPQVGVFVSRSSLAVVEIQRLWMLPMLQLATLGLFLGQGYLGVVHVSWPMALLVLWEGLLGGATCAGQQRDPSRRPPADASPPASRPQT